MLLNTYSGQNSPTTKNYLIPSVNSTNAEQSWCRPKNQMKESLPSRTQGTQMVTTHHDQPHSGQYFRGQMNTGSSDDVPIPERIPRGNPGSLPLLSDHQHESYVIINLRF